MNKKEAQWVFHDYDEFGWAFKCPECNKIIYTMLRRDAPKHCPKCHTKLKPYERRVDIK